MWIDGNGTRTVAVDVMVEVQWKDGYAPPAPSLTPGVARADCVAWAHVARWRVVKVAATAWPAYATEAVAEHDRLTRIIEAKDVALRAAEVRVSELEHERDRAIVQLATTEALLDAANNSTRACLADYANLKCENAKLREIGEFLQDRSTELAMLHHNFNVAALRGHIALDFDEQLVTWVAPR